jgi:hypothetical protein
LDADGVDLAGRDRGDADGVVRPRMQLREQVVALRFGQPFRVVQTG